MDALPPPEMFPHVRIVMGMVVGLGITRLLMGVAGLVQHPGRAKISTLHLLWALSILIELIFFWWWEFALFEVDDWTVGLFFFIILYAVTLFMLAALLFPDSLAEYDGYEDFFLKRRHWFFSLFAATFVLDIIDTVIKGPNHWLEFGWPYYVQVPVGLALSAVAIWTPNRRYHLSLVSLHLLFQGAWLVRLFNTVT